MNVKDDEQHSDNTNSNRPNPWYPQNLTSNAIAVANQQEKEYLQPFPSPTIPKDKSCPSSCRYSNDKTNEPFAKQNPETARQTTPFSIMDPVSTPISPQGPQVPQGPQQMQMQPHQIQFGSHFNPLGYHVPLHQGLNFDSQVRSSALPSPTIYPPTPPPSASWIHPWFTGDSF